MSTNKEYILWKILSTMGHSNVYDKLTDEEYKNRFLKLLAENKGRYQKIDLPNDEHYEEESYNILLNYSFYEALKGNLKKDVNFITKVVEVEPDLYSYLPLTMKRNQEVVLGAIRGNSKNFTLMPNRLKKNKEFVLKAINEINDKQFDIVANISKDLINDKQVVLSAMQKGSSLYSVPTELRNDYDIALASVKSVGTNLKYLKDEYKNNVNIVSNAIKNDPQSMIFASKNLRSDKNFVLLAIEKYHTDVSPYVDESLKNDEDIKNSVNCIDESETL